MTLCDCLCGCRLNVRRNFLILTPELVMSRARNCVGLLVGVSAVSGASMLMLLAIGDAAEAQTVGGVPEVAQNAGQPKDKTSGGKPVKAEPHLIPKPRGLLMDEGSYCDVSAPCPQGCTLDTADTAANKCIEQIE